MATKLRLLENKKIAFLGLGIENLELIKYLAGKKLGAEITICDARDNPELRRQCEELAGPDNGLEIGARLGADYDTNPADFDIIFRSPGYPLFSPALQNVSAANADPDRARKTVITSPIKFFFEVSPTKNIIGVTGTKGKGTTASLIYEILKAAGKWVFLGGNIGVAPFSFADQLGENDWVVLELSSFQLEDMDVSPQIAVFTNFFPDHLAPADPQNPNFHRSLSDYWRAKYNILGWQKKGDTAVINKRLENKKFGFGDGKKIFFVKSGLKNRLPGEHNKENVGAAVAVARLLAIEGRVIEKAVSAFSGLPHRLEMVAEKGGIKYFNDSFATTPESAITALDSFAAPVILIAGGSDKGADFGDLAAAANKKVKLVVLLDGSASPRIKTALLAGGYPRNKIKTAGSMGEAVKLAEAVAQSGDIILLSPACASFGMFRNYKERGELFKKGATA